MSDSKQDGIRIDAQPPTVAEGGPDAETRAALQVASTMPPAVSPADDTEPPNGGLVAWLQVAAGFALYGNTLGLINSYGVYQNFYETTLLKQYSSSNISWIGSIQSFFLMAVGVFIGPLYDAGHCRSLLIVGTLCVALSFMLTSISTEYWSIFLAQGVLGGLGMSCLSIPSVAIVPPYFRPERRPLVISTAALGSGLAATIYPIVFQSLQPRIGFPWAVRVQGFITFVMCLFAVVVARPRYAKDARTNNKKKRTFRTLFKGANLGDLYYILYVVSIVFNNLGYFGPVFYLEGYAELHGGAGHAVTRYLLAILNGSSVFGRLIPSVLSRRLGILNAFIVTVSLDSASIFYWTSASTLAGNIAFAVLYGFFSGGLVAFAPVVLTSLTEDLSYLGTRLGVLNIFKGVASVVGPPIGGAILQSSGGYLGMQLFSAFSVLLTAVFAGILQIMILKGGKETK